MLFIAQRGDISVAFAGLETGRRRIVLDDVVVPIENPDRPIGSDFCGYGGGPFIHAGQQVETIMRDEIAALLIEQAHSDEMAGRLGDKSDAVPVRFRELSRRVDGMSSGSGEAIVKVNLPDRRYRMVFPVVGHAHGSSAEQAAHRLEIAVRDG